MGFLGKMRRRREKKRNEGIAGHNISKSMPHRIGDRGLDSHNRGGYDDAASTMSKKKYPGSRFSRGLGTSRSARDGQSKRGMYGDESHTNTSQSYHAGDRTMYKRMEEVSSPDSKTDTYNDSFGGGERMSQSHREGDGRQLYGSNANNGISQSYHAGQRSTYASQQPSSNLNSAPPPPATQPDVPVWDLFNQQAGDQGLSQSHRPGGDRTLYASQGSDANQSISQSYHAGQRALYSEETTKVLQETNSQSEPVSWLEFNGGNLSNQASSDDLTIESGLAVVKDATPIPSLGSLKEGVAQTSFYLPFFKLSHHIKEREWDRAVQVCLANRYLPKSLRAGNTPEDTRDQFPLHEACLLRAPLFVVKAIADSFESCLLHRDATYGRLPLHIAFIAGCAEEVLMYLVQKSPKSAVEADRLTRVPLHYAFEKCASDLVVMKLLQQGPSAVRAVDNEGWLPIHVACYAGTCPEIMNALIDNYAESVTQTTSQSLLPLDCARGRDNMRVMQIVPIVKRAIKAYHEKERFREKAYATPESDLELL